MLSAFAGGRLFGERHGSGTPRILALHGWGRSHADWSKVLEGFDAVALDLPGFGATPPPEEPWGLTEYAAAVRPVLDEMEPPVVLAGHSFGGSIAVRLASTAGRDAVRALVLTGSPLIRTGGVSKPPLSFRVAKWLNARRLLPDSKMEEMRNARGSADYRAASGVMRDTLVRVVNQDVADLLPSVAVPVELVWGENDGDVPVSVAVAAADLVPTAHLTQLPGVGHDTLAEAPDSLRRVLTALTGPVRNESEAP